MALAGVWGTGMGERPDSAAGEALPAGMSADDRSPGRQSPQSGPRLPAICRVPSTYPPLGGIAFSVVGGGSLRRFREYAPSQVPLNGGVEGPSLRATLLHQTDMN